jgi:hypothetical protein
MTLHTEHARTVAYWQEIEKGNVNIAETHRMRCIISFKSDPKDSNKDEVLKKARELQIKLAVEEEAINEYLDKTFGGDSNGINA